MKKILILIIVTISFVGCSDDFINRAPLDAYTAEGFYKNTDEFDLGVIGAYDVLYDIYAGNLTFKIERLSDETTSVHIDGKGELFNKTYLDSEASIWDALYKMIYRANALIARSESVNVKDANDQAFLESQIGEARTLRALAYFNLVRIYLNVPKIDFFVNDPSKVYGIGTVSPTEIYNDIIIPDLEYAAQHCKTGHAPEFKGRITSWAAKSLLGKVYLTIKDFGKAESVLADVYQNGPYDLVSYDILYRNGQQNSTPFNDESIIELAFKVPEKAYDWNTVTPWGVNVPLDVNPGANMEIATGQYGIYQSMIDAGEKERFDVNIDTTYAYLVPSSEWRDAIFVKKYVQPGTHVGQDTSFYILRYADVLLMYAEALMENGKTGNALAPFNEVRFRANMPLLNSATELTMDVLIRERFHELCFETQRWFDLLRWDKVDEYVGRYLRDIGAINYTIESYQHYYPIPKAERDLDPSIPQTPGY